MVLYDGAKNFLILVMLLLLRKTKPAQGILAAHFIFWYGFLRILVDLFREYPTTLFGMATGQAFNLFMSILGLFLVFWFSRKPRTASDNIDLQITLTAIRTADTARLWPKRIVFASLLLLPLTLPSDWTQDIPSRYGKRHPGMHYSRLYPHVEGNFP